MPRDHLQGYCLVPRSRTQEYYFVWCTFFFFSFFRFYCANTCTSSSNVYRSIYTVLGVNSATLKTTLNFTMHLSEHSCTFLQGGSGRKKWSPQQQCSFVLRHNNEDPGRRLEVPQAGSPGGFTLIILV